MIRIGLRDARGHFGRFVMSIVAIALGVAFVVGSFCFRQMLDNQVSEMMATNADHDVYVRGSEKVSSTGSAAAATSTTGSSDSYNAIDSDLVTTIRKVAGVASASATGSLSGVVLVDHQGDAVSTMGSPTVAIAMGSSKPWRSAHFTSGHEPSGDDEIALHSYAAEKSGLSVGDTTTVVFSDGPRTMRVVGVFSTDSTQAGAIILGISPSLLRHYQSLTSTTSTTTSSIGVYGSLSTPLDAAAQQRLADRINAALPAGSKAHAITGDEMRDESTKTTQEQLGFVQPLILIFAVIALFVGSFIIANTFSMIVRESMRGYALLRSIGASPAQVFSTVIVQALALGVVGSGIGIGLGWGMVRLIVVGLSHAGLPLSGSADPTPGDMAIGFLVGLVVSVIGAALPARRAAFAPPIQAMNETVNPERPVRMRGVLGTAMIVLGAASWTFTVALAEADGDGPTPWGAVNSMSTGWPLGVGAALVILGVIVVGPALVTPAGMALGWLPSRIFRVTGALATRNLSRSRRRTSNTAAALFVGIAIVSCLAVIASSAKTSVSSLIDTGLKADFALNTATYGRIPDGAIKAVEKTKGVGSVTTASVATGVTFGDRSTSASTTVLVARSTLFTKAFAATATAGDPRTALDEGQLVVGSTVATNRGWKVGDKVKVTFSASALTSSATASGASATTSSSATSAQDSAAESTNSSSSATESTTPVTSGSRTLRIGAIIDNAAYRSTVVIGDSTADGFIDSRARIVVDVFVSAAKGQDLPTLKKRLLKAVRPYYVVTVMNHDDYKSAISASIDQMLLILYALLALSILIAIFGIVNTLALNVSERTREIGLLRAIGTSRAQIRGMLGIEAAIISVFGTLLGLATGVAAGAVIRQVYASQGLENLTIPWAQLIGFLLVSILVGLLASVSPASRALRKPVLDAVASE
ncbi:FtsX-like permease family protein [uncultured Bifidobacterium sp.]|uniref:ABC transporter permease n=1 Tax=uncultured Bifidobacterium sp. TaxID=165187 RepID=UPI0028DC8C21|nr:FtsX-like permease family protein [uncultured Bifidobacterium sp.]